MVPPIADNMSTNFADLSLVILSNVGVSKYILTNLNLFFHSKSKYLKLLIVLNKYQIDLEIIETFQCRGKFAPFHIFIIKINIRWYLNFQVHTLLPCRKTCQEKSSTRRGTFNVMITLQDTIKFSWVTNCHLKIYTVRYLK